MTVDLFNENPFVKNVPAEGEDFLGREKRMAGVVAFLKQKDKSCLLIYGQRRMGKTSLLAKLNNMPEIRDMALPVPFNLQNKSRMEMHGLIHILAQWLNNELETGLDISAADYTPAGADEYFRKAFLPGLMKKVPVGKMVLALFDEADVMGETTATAKEPIPDTWAVKQFIPFMERVIDDARQKDYPLKLVFAVGPNYVDGEDRFNPLLKYGAREELQVFTKEETMELLKFADPLVPFTHKAKEAVFEITSGHPYFSQCLAGSAYDAAVSDGAANVTPKVTAEMVYSQIVPTIKTHGSGVFWIWNSMTKRQQGVLFLMADLKNEHSKITLETIREKGMEKNLEALSGDLETILGKLENFGFIVSPKRGEYDFAVDFIRRWITTEIPSFSV